MFDRVVTFDVVHERGAVPSTCLFMDVIIGAPTVPILPP